MCKNAFVVSGLGYGDEGKGSITHWLSCRHRAHTVIRTGGPQALHRVVTGNGVSHVFSQFGSGTLRGSATHLSKCMLIDPHAILAEGEVLQYERGIRGVFDMMTIHEDALVITPFHAIVGRVRELLRGSNRRGSVGIGVGETVRDAYAYPDQAIYARHLEAPDLRERLAAIQRRLWDEFEMVADRASVIDSSVSEHVRRELAWLENPDTVQWAVERFGDLAQRVRVVDTSFVAERILGIEGTVVLEGSQGVLLDPRYGFHPFTTQVRTTPQPALQVLRESNYGGSVQSLGVLRAYYTRHGGGPFVTESEELTRELPDETNKSHPWQGSFRVGHFDRVLARYALKACGGTIDQLVFTCLDRVLSRESWSMCVAYDVASNMTFDDLPIANAGGATHQLEKQEEITRMLSRATPRLQKLEFPATAAQARRFEMLSSVLKSSFNIPVRAFSCGPTENDVRENGQ